MKKIDLGQALAVAANLAVVAGIALLAVELRQNNALLEIQSAGALVDQQIERDLLLLTDQSVSELLTKNRRGEILTDVEESRVGAFYAWNKAQRSAWRNTGREIEESIPLIFSDWSTSALLLLVQ